MRILLCNDDGYQAMGIQTLAAHLAEAGHKVFIVAPNEERSGQSHAMTFFRPILAKKIAHAAFPTWAIFGTPADCATLALQSILAEENIELVVSGINHGLNVGWDVNYSGTVGAATEASLLGYKAIAISVDLENAGTQAPSKDSSQLLQKAFSMAAQTVVETIEKLHTLNWKSCEVLNINHPGIEPKGKTVAHCGGYSMYVPKIVSWPSLQNLPNTPQYTNMNVYMLGGSMRRSNGDLSQDVTLVQNGYVTFSFLQTRQNSTGSSANLEKFLDGKKTNEQR